MGTRVVINGVVPLNALGLAGWRLAEPDHLLPLTFTSSYTPTRYLYQQSAMVLADLGARLHGALNQFSRTSSVDEAVGIRESSAALVGLSISG